MRWMKILDENYYDLIINNAIAPIYANDDTLSGQGDTRFCTTDLRFCGVTVARRTSSTPRSSALQNHKSEAQNSFGPQSPYFGGW